MDLVSELGDSFIESLGLLRQDVSHVIYLDENSIAFLFRDKVYQGTLKGRNAELVLGWGEECDKAIALRVLLDGAATEMT